MYDSEGTHILDAAIIHEKLLMLVYICHRCVIHSNGILWCYSQYIITWLDAQIEAAEQF